MSISFILQDLEKRFCIVFKCHVSLVSFNLEQFLIHFCLLMTSVFLKNYWLIVFERSLKFEFFLCCQGSDSSYVYSTYIIRVITKIYKNICDTCVGLNYFCALIYTTKIFILLIYQDFRCTEYQNQEKM